MTLKRPPPFLLPIAAFALTPLATALSSSKAKLVPPPTDRDFGAFEFLLKRSPFSLPTAEEKSPLGDRYSLTGAASFDGKQWVFLFDKTTQERITLTSDSNDKNINLLEFLPEADPRKMRARVRIGGEVATLAFAEPAPTPGAPQGQQIIAAPGPGAPGAAHPAPQKNISSGQGNAPATPPRRVIKRRIITANPPPPAAP